MRNYWRAFRDVIRDDPTVLFLVVGLIVVEATLITLIFVGGK